MTRLNGVGDEENFSRFLEDRGGNFAMMSIAQHYYDASDNESLLGAFAGIGQSLRVVRLAR